jgi:hypothetical protein
MLARRIGDPATKPGSSLEGLEAAHPLRFLTEVIGAVDRKPMWRRTARGMLMPSSTTCEPAMARTVNPLLVRLARMGDLDVQGWRTNSYARCSGGPSPGW